MKSKQTTVFGFAVILIATILMFGAAEVALAQTTTIANGTYTFSPRPNAKNIQSGFSAEVYIHTIVVDNRYMKIFFADNADGIGAADVPWFHGSYIQDIDNPGRPTNIVINEGWNDEGEHYSYWTVIFEEVRTRRFSLYNESAGIAFEEINLDNAEFEP